MALPHAAELTLSLCKLSDVTEPSLDAPLLGKVLFMGRVFLKRAWRICSAQCSLLMVAQFSAWLPGASQLLKAVAQSNR